MPPEEGDNSIVLDKKGNFYYVDCENRDKNNTKGRPYPR
jgi:hypothetical protein